MRILVVAGLCGLLGADALAEDPLRGGHPRGSGEARAVVNAWSSGDLEVLRALAARDEPDPWFLAHLVLVGGDREAALAFARAVPRPAVAALPEYVAAADVDAEQAVWERLRAFQAALRAEDYRRAVALTDGLSTPPHDVSRVLALHARGLAFQVLTAYEESLAAFEAAARGAEHLGWWARAADECESAGVVIRASGNLKRILPWWQRQLEILQRIGDQAGMGSVLNNMGTVHLDAARHEEAFAHFQRAMAVHRGVGNRRGVLISLGNLAMVQGARGEYVDALARLEALQREEPLGGMPLFRLTTALNIASLHRDLGHGDAAIAGYERVVQDAGASEHPEARLHLAGALCTLSDIHRERGAYANALRHAVQAVDAAEASGSRAMTAAALEALAMAQRQVGRPEEALEAFRRAMREVERVEEADAAARAAGNIAAMLRSLGRTEEARAQQLRLLARFQEAGDRSALAQTHQNLGNGYLDEGDLDRAGTHLGQALAIREEMGEHREVASSLESMGTLEADLGRNDEALARYGRALAILSEHPDQEIRLRVLVGQSRVHLQAGRPAAALGCAREAVLLLTQSTAALAEGEGAAARERWAGAFDYGVGAALATGDVPSLGWFLEHGRGAMLREALGVRAGLRAAVVPRSLNDRLGEAELRERDALGDYRAAVADGDRARRRQARRTLEAAQAAVGRAVADVRREAKAAAALTYPEPEDLRDTRSRLGAGDVLVLYWHGNLDAAALVVTPEGARAVRLGAAEEIDAVLGRLLLAGPPHVDPSGVGPVTERLVAPLGLPSSARRVLVSPAGRLCYVPFALLFPDREVVLLPSATAWSLLGERSPARGEGVLGLGDPVYPSSTSPGTSPPERGPGATDLVPLPATRAEVTAVADRVLLGTEATEAGLRLALAERSRWRAVHLACHGHVDPEDPLRSSLAVTPEDPEDGLLTCLDVFRLSVPADLVVLSACETGRGRIYLAEGVVGLVQAFLFAGSSRVVASLWRVDDDATAALMRRFYEAWNPRDGSEGLAAAAALRAAQEHVRSQDRWAHPRYWAAWVLWGLP